MNNTDQNYYETEDLLSQYMLFHYGEEQDLLPFSFGPKEALHFPTRCVRACVDTASLPPDARALDLGCAVGRSSFELTRICRHVIGVDNSPPFIAAAQQLQMGGEKQYCIFEEGMQKEMRIARLPAGVHSGAAEFQCADAVKFVQKPQLFDVVLAANLLCRLPDPAAFLHCLPNIIAPGGQLIITSPYSWMEPFTPRSKWLAENPLKKMQALFKGRLQLRKAFDMPFLIREHYRKYQWSVAQASIWQ
jgi:putative 4-mercaptohistidine N1-methyltranferase